MSWTLPVASLDSLAWTRRDSGFYVLDQVAREAKSTAGLDALTASSYVVLDKLAVLMWLGPSLGDVLTTAPVPRSDRVVTLEW